MNKNLFYVWAFLVFLISDLSAETTKINVAQNAIDPLSSWTYGITIDSIQNLPSIIESVKSFNKKPFVRIVFDPLNYPYYTESVAKISNYAFIMGELLDSSSMKDLSITQYKDRAIKYISNLPKVTIWEIGNEINGDWLGENSIQKSFEAFKIAKNYNKKTALTLYYNKNCEDNNGSMMAWVKKKIPYQMKQGLDWVTVSYYEDDCNGRIVSEKEWTQVFSELQNIFPNSKVLMGEVGTNILAKKASYMTRYYSMKLPSVKNFIGGYFWWYGYQDLVPKTKARWTTLNNLWMNK